MVSGNEDCPWLGVKYQDLDFKLGISKLISESHTPNKYLFIEFSTILNWFYIRADYIFESMEIRGCRGQTLIKWIRLMKHKSPTILSILKTWWRLNFKFLSSSGPYFFSYWLFLWTWIVDFIVNSCQFWYRKFCLRFHWYDFPWVVQFLRQHAFDQLSLHDFQKFFNNKVMSSNFKTSQYMSIWENAAMCSLLVYF